MIMSYHCPKCDALLNPNVRVVLLAHFAGARSLVLMSSKLGEYQVICDKGFDLGVKKGDIVRVKLLSIDEKGRLRLSRKAAMAEDAAAEGGSDEGGSDESTESDG